MADQLDVVQLGDPENWQHIFAEAQIDFVPDPMILRAAELFLLGRRGSADAGAGEPDEVWGVIEKNIDGILTFFHALMTRRRIPLIDYETTFPSHRFEKVLGSLVVPVHVNYDVYSEIKAEAQDKLKKVVFGKLPASMFKDIGDELGTVGYEWYPDPDVDLPPDQRIMATFLLGGIIFGAYAQASGADHLLQSKRSRLFAELTIPQDEEPVWGNEQQEKIFRRLHEYISTDKRLQSEDFELPPSVLPYLIKKYPDLKTPQELLDKTLELRTGEGKDFREWFQNLRRSWSLGHHNENAEKAVKEVLQELKKRYPHSGDRDKADKPIWATKIDVGIEKAGVKIAANDIELGIPNTVRNWIVERILFRRHKKFLLRLSMAQKSYDNLTMALHKLWMNG